MSYQEDEGEANATHSSSFAEMPTALSKHLRMLRFLRWPSIFNNLHRNVILTIMDIEPYQGWVLHKQRRRAHCPQSRICKQNRLRMEIMGRRKCMVTHGLDFRELARCWSVQVPHVDQLGNRHLGHYHGDDDQLAGRHLHHGDADAWKYLLPSSLVVKKRLHLHIECFLQFLINVSWPFWSKNDPSLNMSQSPISQGMCFQILGALHIKAFKKLYIQKALKSLTYKSFTY